MRPSTSVYGHLCYKNAFTYHSQLFTRQMPQKRHSINLLLITVMNTPTGNSNLYCTCLLRSFIMVTPCFRI